MGGVDAHAVAAPACCRQPSSGQQARLIPDGEVEDERDAIGGRRPVEKFVAVQIPCREAVPGLVHHHGVSAWGGLPPSVVLVFHADGKHVGPRRHFRAAAAEPQACPVLRYRRRVDQRLACCRVVGGGAANLAGQTGLHALTDAHQGVPRRRQEERRRELDADDEDANGVVGLVHVAVVADRPVDPRHTLCDINVDEVKDPSKPAAVVGSDTG